MVKEKMAKEEVTKSSIKSYQQGINTEKQKMTGYSKKFGTTVRSLQAGFKKYSKDIKEAALNMREEGIKNMSKKVGEFKVEIEDQIKENKEAVSRIERGVKFFMNEVKNKRKEFESYAHGPFTDYIKTFWG